jgi:hypothetical protein
MQQQKSTTKMEHRPIIASLDQPEGGCSCMICGGGSIEDWGRGRHCTTSAKKIPKHNSSKYDIMSFVSE